MFHSTEDRLHIEIYRQLVQMSHIYMVVIYSCCHPSGKNIFQGLQILPMSVFFEPTKNRNPHPSEELAEDSDHLNKTRHSFIKRSLGQGNVFISVCHSVHKGVCIQGGLHRGWATPPPNWILRDTVNERAVRILLECILFFNLHLGKYWQFRRSTKRKQK